MAIKNLPKNRKLQIDLTGPQGNAFVLLGYASEFCKKLGKTDEDKKKILDEMKKSDYENLIQVFDREFGSFVDLYR